MNNNNLGYSDHLAEMLDTAPAVLKNFITDLMVIEGKSSFTAKNYFQDIMWLFRYIIYTKQLEIDFDYEELMSVNPHKDYIAIIEAVNPLIDDSFIRAIRKDDVKDFLMFLRKRNCDVASRNRRLSSIKQFLNYCVEEAKILEINYAANIDIAKQEKKVPKYLSLEECNALLDNVREGKNYERNYCILTLFLNCGLRLSELVNLNISDIRGNTLKIYGKGSKERVLHLNQACMKAIETYLQVRYSNVYLVRDKNALFISSNTGTRLKCRSVEKVVYDALDDAGLGGKGYSPHKLRHTAATLMYQYGGVDVLALKDVLGHDRLDTTRIYTHTNSKQIQEALEKNPLAKKNVD